MSTSRAEKVRKTHCQAEALTPENPRYREWILQYTVLEMKKDLGDGDLTTKAFFKTPKKISAYVIAKEDGIFAGRQEIEFFLKNYAHAKFKFLKMDGARLKKGDIVLRLYGAVHELMAVERVILNLIGRMSGVATYTQKFAASVKKIAPKILITPTRKALWGLLDKRACVLGGGGTHRLGLDNAILIKHNHLKTSGVPIATFLKTVIASGAKQSSPPKFLEVEVRNQKDALKAARFFSRAKKSAHFLPRFIMFDNVPPAEIKKAVARLKKEKLHDHVLLEASGRINEKNLNAFAKTGVDVLSIGAITHSAPMLDFSMRIE